MPMFEPRLRIAVLTRHFGRHKGGAENYAVSLAEQLAQHHEVHVFCQSEFNDKPELQTHVMGWSLNKPRWVNMLLYSVWSYWKTRRGFDIVHSHENVFHGNVQTFHVKPVTHNLFHGKRGISRWLTRLKVMFSLRLLSYLTVERARVRHPQKRLLITASQLLQDLYAQTFNIHVFDIQVLTPGVFLPPEWPKSSTPEQRQQSARQQLKLPTDKKLLLMVGHNYQKKGLGALLQALTFLPKDMALAVVGDAAQIPSWQYKATEHDVSDRVYFLGPQTQMEQVYQAADLFVHATLEDVFPIVVLEAMSQGLPVVVSPAPYCLSSNLLTHQQQAWVLKDPHDGQALADAIEQIMTQPSLQSELLKNANIFVQRYSWERLVRDQTRMYFELLSKKP